MNAVTSTIIIVSNRLINATEVNNEREIPLIDSMLIINLLKSVINPLRKNVDTLS